MSITLKLVISGVLFMLTISSGIWLSNKGRPLNAALFNAHKLIALAFVVFTGIVVYNLLKTAPVGTIIIVLIVFSALFIISLFVSGALLSSEKPVNNIMLNLHRIMPVLSAIIVAVTFYLILTRR